MSRKVFTAGEVLAAGDVNSFLMDQTIMSFAGTAARQAAIPTPTLGMYTHLEDTPPRAEFWNGSAWRSPFGATLVASSSFTAQTSVTVNNVFSAAYDSYIVRVSVTPSATSAFTYTLVNGATAAASNYGWNGINMYANGTLVSSFNDINNAATSPVGNANASIDTNYTINIADPFLTRNTFFQQVSQSGVSGNGNNDSHWINLRLNNSTSYEGFRFIVSTGTMTGILRIYGLRNA